jgi:ATP-binding cassette subfamily C protein CydCD
VESGTNAVVGVLGGALPFAAAIVVAGLGLGPTGQVAAAAVLVTAVLADDLGTWPGVVRAVRVGREAATRLAALATSAPSSTAPAVSSDAPAAGSAVGVELDDVSAGWDPDRPVVRGVDLGLAPGRRVALTGPSGSGKSTVAAVVLHLLDPAAGSARLAGVDYRRVSGDDVRRRVGAVGFADHVFAGTVRDNLALGRSDLTDAALRAALRRAHLDRWLASLPHDLDTDLGAGGTTVSGGEARRLSVARALLGSPDVLVLDEPVEGLDAETAEAVMRDLAADDPHVAWLLLAHRPEGLDQVDEVRRLEPNRSTSGTPAAGAHSVVG